MAMGNNWMNGGDRKGMFYTKFGAEFWAFFYGGRSVSYNKKTGEWGFTVSGSIGEEIYLVRMESPSKNVSKFVYKPGMWIYNNGLKDGALTGHADGANRGTVTKQDVQVGLAVTSSVVTCGLATEFFIAGTLTKAIVVESSISLTFDIDQTLSDSNGNSPAEKAIGNIAGNTGIVVYNVVQIGFGQGQKLSTVSDVLKTGNTGFRTLDIINSSAGITNDAINMSNTINSK